jgi:hypothetical protein
MARLHNTLIRLTVQFFTFLWLNEHLSVYHKLGFSGVTKSVSEFHFHSSPNFQVTLVALAMKKILSKFSFWSTLYLVKASGVTVGKLYGKNYSSETSTSGEHNATNQHLDMPKPLRASNRSFKPSYSSSVCKLQTNRFKNC